jgi:hypothetical protein
LRVQGSLKTAPEALAKVETQAHHGAMELYSFDSQEGSIKLRRTRSHRVPLTGYPSDCLLVSQTRPSSHVLGNTPDVRHINDDDEPCASPPLRQRKSNRSVGRWTSKRIVARCESKVERVRLHSSRVPTDLLLAHLLFADSSTSLLFCLHRRHFGRRIYAPFFFRRQEEPRAECSRPDTCYHSHLPTDAHPTASSSSSSGAARP